MSLLAAVARGRSSTVASRAALAQRSPLALRQARRQLGDSVVGPPMTDLGANAKYALQFFTKNPMSYGEFKQQCVSLRIFALAAVNLGICCALFCDPPKSSYWMRMSPTFYYSHLKALLVGGPSPVFLTEKAEQTDVPGIVQQLTTLRRLESAGSDSEDE
mmetsp:Transcript_70573/g.140040  ORF Transcript_70573/g.140040 Transcript_70573/m.140040 type:complete len:160 (+) Transcript_70573:43-522(+)